MKKLLIVGCVLILCCCVSSLVVGLIFGNFELNGKCAYKGPMATGTGLCFTTTDVTTQTNTTANTNTSTNTSGSARSYLGASYSLNYPDAFSINDSDSTMLFVYAPNGVDNMNITKKTKTITTSLASCQMYAQDLADASKDYGTQVVNVTTTTVGSYGACRIDFTANYGTSSGTVNQTQYYIAVGNQTYYETITINSDASNFDALDTIAKSIKFN